VSVAGPIPVALELIQNQEWEAAAEVIERYPAAAGTAEAFLLSVLNALVTTTQSAAAPVPEFGHALIGHLNPGLIALIRAVLLDANGRLEEAVPLYKQSLAEGEVSPWSVDIYYIISALARGGEWQKAEEALNHYLAQNPFADDMEAERESIIKKDSAYFRSPQIAESFSIACIKLASFCNNFGQYISGLHYLQYATFMNGDLSAINLVKGLLYQGMEVSDEALIAYQSVNAESVRYPYTQVLMANLEHEIGDTSSALSALRELVVQFPEHRYAKLALARMLMVQKEYTHAVEVVDRLITDAQDKLWPEPVRKPALAYLYYLRALCHYEIGAWEKEEADIQQSLVYDPQNPEALNHLGYSWLEHDIKIAEAHEILKKALALSPEHPAIMDSYGWSLYKNGKYEEALPFIEKALQAMPQDPTVQEHLGDIYWCLNRQVQARYQWENALTSFTNNKDQERIREKLAHGLNEVAPIAE